MGGLEGRHVVVTGSQGNLGEAVVEAFAAAGAELHLPVRRAPAAPARDAVHVVPDVDLTDEAAVARFYGTLPALWASVHLAGGFAAAPLLETRRADLAQQLDLNLVTAFLCCREAVRRMHRSGGRIVNVGSMAGIDPGRGRIAYAVSKAAVGMLTRAVAAEAGAQGILVNAVLPSTIDTPANRAAMPQADHDRWPKPRDIARTIVWLASPGNTLTTGTLLPVTGP